MERLWEEPSLKTLEQITRHIVAMRDWKVPYLTALPEMAGSIGTRLVPMVDFAKTLAWSGLGEKICHLFRTFSSQQDISHTCLNNLMMHKPASSGLDSFAMLP